MYQTPLVLVFLKLIEFNSHLNLMILGRVLWFVSAPFWMKKEQHDLQKD